MVEIQSCEKSLSALILYPVRKSERGFPDRLPEGFRDVRIKKSELMLKVLQERARAFRTSEERQEKYKGKNLL